MSTFTVVSSTVKREIPDAQYGPAKIIELHLENGGSDIPLIADWFTKATTPLPENGARLEGDLKPAKFGGGYDFKKASNNNFQGGGSRGRSPEERRSIQFQHAQKCAVDIARLALERAEVPAGSEQITAVVKTVARALFDQIEEAAK